MESNRSRVLDSICDAVGQTPLVRLARIAQGLPCELFAKCEFMNPGGSIKDRIGVRMLLDAERQGRIKPGDTLIEPTSGNTGIGLALAAAVRGYRLIITMPEKMSQEKQVVLEALGAEIIRTPTEAAWDAPESHIGVARRLHEIIPNSHILDQYANSSNPLAHEEGTAREILEQCGGELDAVVVAAGTGGTITGVARAIKRDVPHAQVIGVDPTGSILAGPGEVHSYKVEGIGYDFIPQVLDRSLVDRWIKTNDRDSFITARQLIRREGLLVGGSSGAAVWAALQVARQMRAGQRLVVILPDSIRNYLTKFASDSWMRSNGFEQDRWQEAVVENILSALPKREVITVPVDAPVALVLSVFKEHGISQVPVTDGGKLAGILTENDVLHHVFHGRIGAQTKVAEVMVRQVASIGVGANARELPQILDDNVAAVVVNEAREVVGILTKIDLIEVLASRNPSLQQAEV